MIRNDKSNYIFSELVLNFHISFFVSSSFFMSNAEAGRFGQHFCDTMIHCIPHQKRYLRNISSVFRTFQKRYSNPCCDEIAAETEFCPENRAWIGSEAHHISTKGKLVIIWQHRERK